MQHTISYGIDVFLNRVPEYKNKRLALVTNNAAITAKGILSRKALLDTGFNLVHLYSPEHGINRAGEDGAAQEDELDEITGLPVTSLYGSRLKPSRQQLQDVDLLLFDIPDIGCRFYTYLWTMTHVMEACEAYHVPLIILDRPNPIGALMEQAEGPMLNETECSSFIGRWAIPLRHSCTLAELARYFASSRTPELDLQVICAENYHRSQTAIHDFDFVPTSPAMPDVHSAMLYPGTGLLEGINVNEGRGTDKPFRICGAPFIRGEKLQEALVATCPEGVKIESIIYRPTEGLYKDETCEGVRFTVTDADILKPVALGITLIETLFRLYPEQISKRLYPTAVNPSGAGHLDRLLGVPGSFELLKNQTPINTDVRKIWPEAIKPFLLYK